MSISQVHSNKDLVPGVDANDKVILFDGVCKLCNAWSNFIITHDTGHLFKLASVQSDAGKAILRPLHNVTNADKTRQKQAK